MFMSGVNAEKIIYYFQSLFLDYQKKKKFKQKGRIHMKHEVKYQELSDEQLAVVAGGNGWNGGWGSNQGDTTNDFTQGSPTAVNVNSVTQSADHSKNVKQNSWSYQNANAVNSINNK